MQRGLMIYPGSGTVDGAAGDHFLLAPPFVITREEINSLVSLLDEALTATESRFLG
jgi:adenosylmethionine-8-amino-7-oxononanoate aminotransferase